MEVLEASKHSQITMSSLELVQFINNQRGVGSPELMHSDFLKKVIIVLGGEGNFSSTYIDSQNKVRPCYRFPKREACLMAMSYSYDLQAKVFDRMTALEAAQAPNFLIPKTLSEALLLGAELAKKNEEQAEQLAIAAPKILVYERLADRRQDVSTTLVAKQLGTTAIKLNQFMRDNGYKMRNIDAPKAGFDEWFNVVSDSKNGHEYSQCLITPLGQIEIAKAWEFR